MKVIIRQTRSQIGRDERVRSSLRALGLGRIGKEVTQELTPSVAGIINRIKQVVTVRKA